MISTPAGIYLLKVNNKSTRTRCEICSKLTIKTLERRQWRHSGVFIVHFEHISYLVLVFLLLTLNRKLLAGATASKTSELSVSSAFCDVCCQHIFLPLVDFLWLTRQPLIISSSCNLGQNICKLFYVLAQFFFITSET